MAKKKASQMNKSQLIRDYFDANPRTKPKAIAEALSEQTGATFTPTAVSTTLNVYKKKKKGVAKTKPKPSGQKTSNGAGDLLKAADFVRSVGGMEKATRLMQDLNQIADKLG